MAPDIFSYRKEEIKFNEVREHLFFILITENLCQPLRASNEPVINLYRARVFSDVTLRGHYF